MNTGTTMRMTRPPHGDPTHGRSLWDASVAPPGGLAAMPLTHRSFGWLVWLTAACGALVWREPAPYELLFMPMATCLFLFGLPLRRAQAPLVLFTVLVSAGGFLALVNARHEPMVATQFVVVTAYLMVTALVFAAFVADDPERHGRLVLTGTVAAGVIASLAAVLGYLGNIDAFMIYGRAKGTFEDPNVLGAFLILPACTLLAMGLTRPLRRGLVPTLLFAVLALGLFLTFSRAAWGLLVLCGGLTVFFTYATSGRSEERLRIAGLAGAGLLVAVLGIAVAVAHPATADLLAERATLNQSYDTGYMGRFDRYSDGLVIALTHPIGFGALQFRHYYPEEIHNVYLNVVMGYGWLGGLAYSVAVLWTLAKCGRLLQRRDPLRALTIPVAAAFIGMAVEGLIIDTDHWRHWFLLMGLVWGLDRAAPVRDAAARV